MTPTRFYSSRFLRRKTHTIPIFNTNMQKGPSRLFKVSWWRSRFVQSWSSLSENCRDKKKSYYEGHLDYGTSTGFGERRRSEEKVLTLICFRPTNSESALLMRCRMGRYQYAEGFREDFIEM